MEAQWDAIFCKADEQIYGYILLLFVYDRIYIVYYLASQELTYIYDGKEGSAG